jgi:transcriptional regulator with XRE-family HTH domain
MKDRLKQFRKSLRLTQREFGEKIGMSDVAISYMESGRTALSEQNIKLICLTFGIREEWLREGKGEMLDDGKDLLSEQEKHLLELFRKLSPRTCDLIIEYIKKVISDEQAIREELMKTTLSTRREKHGDLTLEHKNTGDEVSAIDFEEDRTAG